MILNFNKAFIVIASIFYIQNSFALYNTPPVEDDKFFDALIQELDFFEADWMDNHSITRDIILGASWVNQDDQENYLGEIIFSDKKLLSLDINEILDGRKILKIETNKFK